MPNFKKFILSPLAARAPRNFRFRRTPSAQNATPTVEDQLTPVVTPVANEAPESAAVQQGVTVSPEEGVLRDEAEAAEPPTTLEEAPSGAEGEVVVGTAQPRSENKESGMRRAARLALYPTLLVLDVAHASADVCPPLKSAVGGVRAIAEIMMVSSQTDFKHCSVFLLTQFAEWI